MKIRSGKKKVPEDLNRLIEEQNAIQLANIYFNNLTKVKNKASVLEEESLKKQFHDNTHIASMKIKQRMTSTDPQQYRSNITPYTIELPNAPPLNNNPAMPQHDVAGFNGQRNSIDMYGQVKKLFLKPPCPTNNNF